MPAEISRFTFKPGARTIILLGEELIGHPTTAINELVKNSYDADATECKVYLYVSDSGRDSFLIVADNGLGMAKETLFGEWLQPSLSSKRKPNARSEVFDRALLGSKGIGRLAAMALGATITVISKRNKEAEYNWLALRSSDFQSDILLEQVAIPGGHVSSSTSVFIQPELTKARGAYLNEALARFLITHDLDRFQEGTLVVIEGLDEALAKLHSTDFSGKDERMTLTDTAVYRGLSNLITPLELNRVIQKELTDENIIDASAVRRLSSTESHFSIRYGTNLLEDGFELSPVEASKILHQFDYRFYGKVDASGAVRGRYICERLKKDRFKESFDIGARDVLKEEYEKLGESLSHDGGPQELNAVGEFFFDIRLYDRGEEDSKKRLFELIPGEQETRKKEELDRILGLRISKMGFGVKPYGDEMKDWIGLNQIRVQNPGQNVSENQILGYVYLYNDRLQEKTNREGFYESEEFIALRKIMRVIFKNIGQQRYNYRLKHNLGRLPRHRFERPDFDGFLKFLSSKTGDKAVISRAKKMVDEVNDSLDNMEQILQLSQRLATLGTGMELVYHELAQPISKIGAARTLLSRAANRITDPEIKSAIQDEVLSIGSFVHELDELKQSLKPAIGRSKHKLFKPSDTFRKVCHLYRRDIASKAIKIEVSESKATSREIDSHEYAFWVSFLNIVNNALYWLGLMESERQIRFEILAEGTMTVSNTGPEIPEEYLERIFEYGFTMKKEKDATGLGLAFTKNLLNLIQWDITAANTPKGPVFSIQKPQL